MTSVTVFRGMTSVGHVDVDGALIGDYRIQLGTIRLPFMPMLSAAAFYEQVRDNRNAAVQIEVLVRDVDGRMLMQWPEHGLNHNGQTPLRMRVHPIHTLLSALRTIGQVRSNDANLEGAPVISVREGGDIEAPFHTTRYYIVTEQFLVALADIARRQ